MFSPKWGKGIGSEREGVHEPQSAHEWEDIKTD